MSFERAIAFLDPQEGDWANDPHDHGRRTRWGISQRAHPKVDLDTLTKEGAHDIYFRQYWLKARCHLLPEPLDQVVFDAAVHSGVSQSIRWLQESVDVHPDGKMGERTRDAVNHEVARDGAEMLAIETLMRRQMFMVRGFRRGSFSPEKPLHFLGGFWKRTLQLAYEIGDYENQS